MPKIAKAVKEKKKKYLVQKGLMPNLKKQIIVGDLDKILPELDKGQVEVRLQPSNKVIHLVIGKLQDEDTNLLLTTLN